MKTLPKIISENIKKLRANKGWNQAKLARESGITGAALSKIETDDNRSPSIDTLQKLSEALNVHLDYIILEGEMDEDRKYEKLPILNRLEDSIYQHFEELGDDIDPRWKNISKTHIQQGFMAIKRAMFEGKRIGDN